MSAEKRVPNPTPRPTGPNTPTKPNTDFEKRGSVEKDDSLASFLRDNPPPPKKK